MITEQELQTALQSFVGQNYDNWGTASNVFSAVRKLLEADGVTDLYYDNERQVVTITYKRKPLLEISVSKAKGKKHYGYYGGGWCDWTIKSISVFILGQDRTIAGRIKEIEDCLVAQAIAADKQLQEAIIAVKAMQAALPDKGEWALKDLIKYIADHRYTIFDKVKGE